MQVFEHSRRPISKASKRLQIVGVCLVAGLVWALGYYVMQLDPEQRRMALLEMAERADPSAGATVFRKRCIDCHIRNNDGGLRAPILEQELPRLIVEWGRNRTQQYLVDKLLSPESTVRVRYEFPMVLVAEPLSDQDIAGLVAYLMRFEVRKK